MIDVVEPPPKARRMEATLHVLDSSDEELEDDEDELHVNIAKCFIKWRRILIINVDYHHDGKLH